MANTAISSAAPEARKLWSAILQRDIPKDSYFGKRFVGKPNKMDNSSGYIIHEIDELGSEQGDRVTIQLSRALRNKPTKGDSTFEGNEEEIALYTDSVYIDQLRQGPSLGGRMTRKRTLIDMRKEAKNLLTDYWARYMDELFFIYLSGARGVNSDFIEDTDFTGTAGNAITAPDAHHIMYGGDATSKATVDSTDKMTTIMIERMVVKAKTMGGGIEGIPKIKPVNVEGEKRFVLVMSPNQEFDLRTATGTGGWLDIQKAAAGAEGKTNPIFKGSLGMYNNVVLHSHENVIHFSDYGSGSNVHAERALFMGEQAGVIAYGVPGSGAMEGSRFNWVEKTFDYDNQVGISAGTICGIKKTTYKRGSASYDFGVIAIDTAGASPN